MKTTPPQQPTPSSSEDPSIDPYGGLDEEPPDDETYDFAQEIHFLSREELRQIAGTDGPDMPGHYLDELLDREE